ncbi:MAG: hypothetical protein IJ094_04725 [Bacilli bacterium]|nr:hypothetical protein [Bacilli bacterium]
MGLVYQNINESAFICEIKEIKFYFSSSFNLRRFKEKCLDYALSEERKVINKFHIDIDMEKYLLISFYKKIEKRGFLIEYNEKVYKDDIILCTEIK